jgi:hypothetical protein
VKLPNPERAVADLSKLLGYSLNASHFRGRHKARVFGSVLGITAQDAHALREAILQAAIIGDAKPSYRDEYGQPYMVDFEWTGPALDAVLRSCWIVRTGEDFPRLTNCYVRKEGRRGSENV